MLRDIVTQLLEQSSCHYSLDSDGDILILLSIAARSAPRVVALVCARDAA